MLNVYQIIITSAQCDSINRLGRAAGQDKFPHYEAYGRLQMGAPKFTPSDSQHFRKVATVDTNDLEECFVIMNRWADDDEAKVTRLDDLHSLSVGDLVERDGEYFMVDICGFQKVNTPVPSEC